MAGMGESSSTAQNSTNEKPVVIRVKRKSYQSRLDAFWLEINERPLKRALLDLQKLSVTDEESKVEELKCKKVFVQHVETVSNSDAIIDVLQSFVVPSSANAVEVIPKGEERKLSLKKDSKQEQLLSRARQSQEVSAQNARFEQIWRRRRGNKEASHDKALHDMCHFYDIVRVDVEGRSIEKQEQEQEQEIMSLEDQELLSSYLPLLREFIPSAAADIESDMCGNISKPASADDYVYDYYTARDDIDMDDGDSLCPFPLVQVEDEDFYDGPDDESDYESDDSNAEHHPWNEYPDEEESGTSSNESEDDDDDKSSRSSEIEERLHGLSKVAVPFREGGMDDDDDGDDTFDDYEDDDNFEYGDDDEDRRHC